MALATERQRPAADVGHAHGARHSNSGTSGHDGRKMATRTLRERNDGRVLLHQRANGARSPLPLMYSRIATATTAAATVPKVDRGARMSSVRGLHCNGCASTATASTAMSSLSVECARPALHWMCASTAMSCGYYCANYRDHDDRRRTVTALKYRHMIRHTTNGIHIGRIKLSLISNLRPTVGIIRTPAVYKVLCCSAHF